MPPSSALRCFWSLLQSLPKLGKRPDRSHGIHLEVSSSLERELHPGAELTSTRDLSINPAALPRVPSSPTTLLHCSTSTVTIFFPWSHDQPLHFYSEGQCCHEHPPYSPHLLPAPPAATAVSETAAPIRSIRPLSQAPSMLGCARRATGRPWRRGDHGGVEGRVRLGCGRTAAAAAAAGGSGGRRAAEGQRGEGSSTRAATDGDEGGSSWGGERARGGKPWQCEHNRRMSR